MPEFTIHCGDCLDVLPTLESASVDCVITDPPYPEIDRDYGRMSECDWHAMMDVVVPECRRILKPTGSAVFILQPNSERVGRMRPWLWEFMAKWTREWGMVQDAWWWNSCAVPSAGATTAGLLRGSIKPCVWLGLEDCYRNQSAVLWTESQKNAAERVVARADNKREGRPSGHSFNEYASRHAAVTRGGTTPFNLIPVGNNGNGTGHTACTPEGLADWWVSYICPDGGVVLDPFVGSGTVALAALNQDCKAIGIESDEGYIAIAKRRIEAAAAQLKLFVA